MSNTHSKPIEELQHLVGELEARIGELSARVTKLEVENAELRNRLNLNSSNSHKPPSTDGLKKKTRKPGLPKEEGQLNGGQRGIREKH